MSEQIIRQAIEASAQIIYLMISEGKLANAVVVLFVLKQTNPESWLVLREDLLQKAYDQRTLQTIASILEASGRRSLSESAHLIPGLSVFALEECRQNLLMH